MYSAKLLTTSFLIRLDASSLSSILNRKYIFCSEDLNTDPRAYFIYERGKIVSVFGTLFSISIRNVVVRASIVVYADASSSSNISTTGARSTER